MDNAEAALIGGSRIAYQSLGLSAWNWHIDDLKVGVVHVSFNLSKAVAGCAQDFAQLESFARDKGGHLMAKRQTLLDGYAEESSARIADAVCQRIDWMIHVQKDLGDRADVNDGFEKAQDRRECAAALDDGDRANSVQRDVSDSGEDDEPKRDEDCAVHG